MKLNLTIQPRFRIGLLPIILLALAGIAFVVAMLRFAFGIGAISSLSNAYPWAFWISFDLLTGVAIAAGGFILAAIVEVFALKEFRPLLRPAMLTGFLGYIMYVLALLVDLGHPERIWHYFIYQNHTSILFECGILVMIISFLFAMLFAPDVLERFNQPKLAKLIRFANLPLVILLVVASTLHQGSLGSIYLIMSAKLHSLWWTPILPLLFIISSVPIGLAMVIFESTLSARYFKHGAEKHPLGKMARIIPWALGLYLVIKFGQLALAGNLGFLFTSGALSVSFWAEILIGVVAPLILFSMKSVRQSPNGLFISAVITLLGMILNRFNVSWFAIRHADPISYVPTFMNKVSYLPSLSEMAISIGIFSAGILAFGLAAKFLPIFEHNEHAHSPATGD